MINKNTKEEREEKINRYNAIQLENSLLKETIKKQTELFIMQQQEHNDFMRNTRDWIENTNNITTNLLKQFNIQFDQNNKEIRKSVSEIEAANQKIANSVGSEMATIQDNIQKGCKEIVDKSLTESMKRVEINIVEAKQEMLKVVDKVKTINKMFESHVSNFTRQKEKFFRFDGTKTFFFWTSQVINFLTLILLVFWR
ncbi:MAG: hypothetical protein R3Y33_00130 [Clostridia bacterium]